MRMLNLFMIVESFFPFEWGDSIDGICKRGVLFNLILSFFKYNFELNDSMYS